MKIPNPVTSPALEPGKHLLAANETRQTRSGRLTTPFPAVDLSTNRRAVNTMRRVDTWLMTNALEEARLRHDTFATLQFEANLVRPPQASKEAAHNYLFDN